MDERSSRIFVGLCLLVLVWIGVYWMWEPEGSDPPRITFADQPVQIEDPPLDDPLVIEQRPVEQDPVEQAPVESVVRERVVPPTVITDLDQRSETVEVIAPVFAQHTVREDETMGTIARSIYGSSSKWEVIARANPRVDPKRLKVGQVLRIPVDPDNVQGKVIASDPNDGTRPKSPPKVVEYFIQSGDSLSRIAERFYGSSRHARMIFEYNSDTLESMDDLKIGQLLRLPPLEETDESDG